MTNEDPSGLSWFSRIRKARKNEAKKNATKEPESNVVLEVPPGTPSKKDYFIEASKKTIEIISGVTGLVGVPLVKEVLDIGLSLLTTCEAINQVQGKLAELKNRLASFLLVIAKVAGDPTQNSLFKSSEGLIQELQDLKECLTCITTRLKTVSSQNILLTTLLPKSNLDTIEECVNSFQDAINRFQTLRGIHAAQDLSKIQAELEDIYGLTTAVVLKVDHIEVEVREVKNSVDELKLLLDRTRTATELDLVSTEMPPVPEIFLGRDTVVEQIAEALASGDTEKSRVCILGPGGIGKTSAALAAIEHPIVKAKFAPQNCIWIPCVSLTSPIALLTHLARRFSISTQKDTLRVIVTTLEQDRNDYIILLDNFETPWHPTDGDQILARNILRALDKVTNVAILVTMRSELPPLPHWKAERLDVLPIDHCRHIYTTIEPLGESDEALDPLLEAIGRLPYAVTLVATQAKYANASPTQMLAEWNAVGSQLLSDVEDSSKGMDSSIELSVKSKYITSSAGAIELLQVLSMLPGGVYQDDLSIWMQSWRLTALSTLRNSALIITRNVDIGGKKRVLLFVLPVVQSYMRHQGVISMATKQEVHNACLKFLAMRKSVVEGPNDPKYRDDLPQIIAQEVNIQAIMAEILSDPNHEIEGSSSANPEVASRDQLDASLSFAFYYCWTQPRLDIAEQVLSLCQHSKSLLHEAEATYCLAKHYDVLYASTSSSAVATMERSRDLFLALDKPHFAKACFIDCQIPLNLVEAGCDYVAYQDSIAALKARWEPLFPSNRTVLGLVTHWTAFSSWMTTYESEDDHDPEYPLILPNLQEAEAILTDAQRPNDLRECYMSLTRYLLQERKITEARHYVDCALDLTAKEHLPDYPLVHICHARCIKASGDWGSELSTTIQDGLSSARRLGLPYSIASLLEELAEVYVREEDWLAAQLTFEEILKECRKAEGYYSIDEAKSAAENNLRYTLMKQANSLEESICYQAPQRY